MFPIFTWHSELSAWDMSRHRTRRLTRSTASPERWRGLEWTGVHSNPENCSGETKRRMTKGPNPELAHPVSFKGLEDHAGALLPKMGTSPRGRFGGMGCLEKVPQLITTAQMGTSQIRWNRVPWGGIGIEEGESCGCKTRQDGLSSRASGFKLGNCTKGSLC